MIKLHHLNKSRSKRIIWLLEELGVRYEIIRYQRDKVSNLAPPELLAIHPLGKSPVIEDAGQVIAESGAIVEYLTDKYGSSNLMPEKGSAEYIEYLQWLHFAEGSAALPMLLGYFVKRDGAKTNFLHTYAQSELAKILKYYDQSVTQSDYLVGDKFTSADILNSFVIEQVQQAYGLDQYPALNNYFKRLKQRPGNQKADVLEASD